MGGSGAGKTTLLNVLLGKEEKTAGHILVDDGSGLKLVKRGLSAVRKLIGFVPQGEFQVGVRHDTGSAVLMVRGADDVMIRELTVREVCRTFHHDELLPSPPALLSELAAICQNPVAQEPTFPG